MIRVDGRGFKNLLYKQGFEKPFDYRFASAMAGAAESLAHQSGLHPVIAYTFSDEINILLTDQVIAFDGRVIPLHPHQIPEYLIWRQLEAWRNCINSYGHYTLRSTGLSGRDAASRMQGMRSCDIRIIGQGCSIKDAGYALVRYS
jgi:tRNA(His) 5'-end guanylyltransferase